MADVAALIPTLGNDVARVLRAVTAVLASDSTFSVEVVVVVNAKVDPFAEVAVTLPANVRVIVAGANLGWAGGLHVGRAATTARFIWLVQDDMDPDTACLRTLAAALEDPRGPALVSPVIVSNVTRDARGAITEGTVERHTLGGSLNPEVFDSSASRPEDDPIMADRFPVEDTGLAELSSVPALDYIPSRGMLLAASTWDAVGGMDARFYPVGATDVDFCRAIHAAGLTFAIVPQARATHLGSASTPRSLARVVFRSNRRRVVEKWRDGEVFSATIAAEVPDAVRDAVLIGATEAFSALAEELERVTAQRDALRQRLKAFAE